MYFCFKLSFTSVSTLWDKIIKKSLKQFKIYIFLQGLRSYFRQRKQKTLKKIVEIKV